MNEAGQSIVLKDVSVPGCVACAQFDKIWPDIQKEFPDVSMEKIDATTPEGQKMVVDFGIFSAPGIIVNGELFSTGGVNRDELIKKLRELTWKKTCWIK